MTIILNPKRFYRQLHRIADAQLPAISRAFLDAVNRAKGGLDMVRVMQAVKDNDPQSAFAAINLAKTLDPTLRREMTRSLAAAFQRAAIASQPLLSAAEPFSITVASNAALEFAGTHTAHLIREVSAETKANVRAIMRESFSSGATAQDTAVRIREAVGLTKRERVAVENAEGRLFREIRAANTSWSFDAVETEARRQAIDYAADVLRARALRIARTESIRAANGGHLDMVRQAIDDGLVSESDVRIQWIVTPGDATCEICSVIPELNPDGVAFGGEFETPDGPVEMPPVHPNCRCGVAPVIDRDRARERVRAAVARARLAGVEAA